MGQADVHRQTALGSPCRSPALQFKIRSAVFRPQQRQFIKGKSPQPGPRCLQESLLGGKVGRRRFGTALTGKSLQKRPLRRGIDILTERSLFQAHTFTT